MILAIDNQISLQVVSKLRRTHEVAVWAAQRDDSDWIEEALELGAEVFISPDLDIPNYLDKVGSDAKWIDVPQGLKTSNQFDFISKKLKELEQANK